MLPENSCELGTVVFDFHANNHIDPPFSHGWVWGLVGILVYCIIRSLLFRAKSLRLAHESDAAVDPKAPLAVGNSFVSGRVEYAEGQSSAITVHVEQKGTESKTKNGWTHRWTESSRTTNAFPFYVCRPNGERVRVEPGAKPLLVDKPDQIQWKERTLRIRIAALTRGEEVIVQGKLGKGHDPELRNGGDYRSSGQGWVMAPIDGDRMEVSTEKRGERHRKRARAFGKTLRSLLGTLALVNLIFLYYPFRLFGGVDSCAQVLKKDTSISSDSKGRRTTHYNVHVLVDTPDKPILTRELDDSDWDQVQTGTVLAFRDVPIWRSMSELGTGASTHILTIIFGTLAVMIGAGFYAGTRDYRRWYEGKLEDSGSGQLPEPPLEK
jgi:hypothetical protein